MARLFAAQGQTELFERLRPAYANAGIDQRYSCVPLSWYGEPHGWRERTALYIDNALDLAVEASWACLGRSGLGTEDMDAVVTISTTGIATPSLDALVIERMALRPDVTRLPVFGLGCAGGVLGVARAAALARAMPGRRVLLVVVELCGLTFRPADPSKSNIVATALFGDGAAAAVLSTEGDGPSITGTGEYTWPGTLDVMGWRVEDDGLGVLFSQDIPTIVRNRMGPAAAHVLAGEGLTFGDIDGFVCHPGGAKVIVALEDAFALPEGGLDVAREVLRRHGNMSAPTVLFVLERTLARDVARDVGGAFRRYLLTALGPGFTAGFVLLEAG